MALILQNNFEGGSNGTAMTTGNTGPPSGNAFDAVTATVPNFSTAQSAHGALSAAIQAAGHVDWTAGTSLPASGFTTAFGRAYVLITAAPTVVTHIPSILTSASATASGFFELTTASKILTQARGGTTVTSTTVLALNTWYRIEFKHVIVASGTCTFDCTIYLGDSTVPVETMAQATGTGLAGDTTFSVCRWGSTNATVANTVFFDDINLNDQGFPGPTFLPVAQGETSKFPRLQPWLRSGPPILVKQVFDYPPVGAAAPATPLIQPVIVQANQRAERQPRRTQVIQNRWPGYQWVGLPPVNPLIEPQVVAEAVKTAAAQQDRARRSHVRSPSAPPMGVVTPTKPIIVTQTPQTAERRSPERHTNVIANRWPGYQWVGLPPVNPLPKQVVQDQAAQWQELREHRRSLVIQPAVQLAAATAGTAPPTVTPTKSVIVGQAVQRGQAEQNRERRTHVIQNRWPGYQWVGLPPVVPLTKTVVQDQAALWQELREHRRGEVLQPGVQLAAASSVAPPVTPLPRCIVIQARPAAPKQRRAGHVIAGRAAMVPTVVPARPNVVHTTITRPRRRGGAQWAQGQRFVPTGIQPTLITTPATGYVSVGDSGPPVAGSSGKPGVGDTGVVKAGLSGQVRI